MRVRTTTHRYERSDTVNRGKRNERRKSRERTVNASLMLCNTKQPGFFHKMGKLASERLYTHEKGIRMTIPSKEDFVTIALIAFMTCTSFDEAKATSSSRSSDVYSSAKVLGTSEPGPAFSSNAVLGTCESFQPYTCFSSMDDRPPYFIAPWSWETGSDLRNYRLDRTSGHNDKSRLKDINDSKKNVEYIVGQLKDVLEKEGFHSINLVIEDGEIGDKGVYVSAQTSKVSNLFRDEIECTVEFYIETKGDSVVQVRLFVNNNLPDNESNASLVTTNILHSIPPFFNRYDNILSRVRLRLQWEEVIVLRNRTRSVFGIFESPFDQFGPTPPAGEILAEIDPDDKLASYGPRGYMVSRD